MFRPQTFGMLARSLQYRRMGRNDDGPRQTTDRTPPRTEGTLTSSRILLLRTLFMDD